MAAPLACTHTHTTHKIHRNTQEWKGIQLQHLLHMKNLKSLFLGLGKAHEQKCHLFIVTSLGDYGIYLLSKITQMLETSNLIHLSKRSTYTVMFTAQCKAHLYCHQMTCRLNYGTQVFCAFHGIWHESNDHIECSANFKIYSAKRESGSTENKHSTKKSQFSLSWILFWFIAA